MGMLKKLLTICSIFVTGTNIAMADGNVPVETHGISFEANGYTWQADPYVGFGIGPVIYTAGAPFTYSGLGGTLSLGLVHVWDHRLSLAGELFVGNNIRIATTGTGSPPLSINDLEAAWNYGFDLIPGMLLMPNLLGYLRLGVVNTQFTMNSTSGNLIEHITGWQVGPGIQTNVYRNLDCRAEYVFTQYSQRDNPPIGTEYANQVNLGLVLKFM
jgi:opacity protein-like surface antigen